MRLTVYFPEDSPTTHEFIGNKLTVGRLGDNDVALDEGSVSGRHAEIEVQDGRIVLRDLGSTNGTFHNAEPVSGEVEISEGDEIHFGSVRSVFMEPVSEIAAPPVSVPEVASALPGGRPDNFRYLSPMPRPAPARDPLALAAWAVAGLAFVAAAAEAVVLVAT
jgi:predicted component of type VI protein secretion system